MIIRYLRLLFLLPLILAALTCAALDIDDDDDAANFQTSVTLSLDYDSQGSVSVNLDLPGNPKSWEPLRTTLAQALHCPLDRLSNPTSSAESTRLPDNWTTAQRARYLKQIFKFNQRRLTGKCDSALSRQGGVLQGDIVYAPFAAELARTGAERLNLFISVPQTTYLEYSHTNLSRKPFPSSKFLTYQITLGANLQAAPIHLEFGFRKKDLYRALGILSGFILLPLFATLWMIRSAMHLGKTDPTAAWFGFIRTFNLLMLGSMLLWITSGFGARQDLQDWIATLQLSNWESIVFRVLILVGPAFGVYLLCIAVSYPVHAQLRGSGLSRREFLLQQMVTVGTQAVPLMLALAALELIRQETEVAIALLIAALLVFQIFQYLKLRVIKICPQALTTGELRDRVFALAGRMGVEVRQVFVLPAGKGQVANAYAAKNKIVLFTDYLLEHLNKREVDAVAAHELAHLQHKHPSKRTVAFFAAILLPTYFPWISGTVMGLIALPLGLLSRATGWSNLISRFLAVTMAFEQWSQHDFVLIVLGLTGFYFLSRRFENVADAAAVRVTGDPEAQITGLLKLNRLNRIPIQWGKASESWLTHPSTVRRAERIAGVAGMTPEQLQEILGRFAAQNRPGSTAAPAVEVPQDHYIVPAANDPERIRAATSDLFTSQIKAWAMLIAYLFPSALFAFLIEKSQLEGAYAFAVYLASLAIAAIFVTLAGVWIGESGQARIRRRLLQRFEHEGIPAGRAGDVLVCFAPAAFPRIYGTRYHWDRGFLIFAKECIQFVGEHTRFSLSAKEIDAIVLGRGGPSWWKFERIYVHWKNSATQDCGIFNFYLHEPCSMWKRQAAVRALYRRLLAWRENSLEQPAVRPELLNLQVPKIGEVTCVSPSTIGKIGVNLKYFYILLLLAISVGTLLHVSIFPLCTTVVLLRVFHLIPYWRYKDKPPTFAPASTIS